jgi:hypothetical protein
MNGNETAAPCVTTERPARNPGQPGKHTEGTPRRKSTGARVEKRPLSSRVLAEIVRGPASRIVVSLDEWPTGNYVRFAALRQTASGTWYVNRSFGLNVMFAPAVIEALEAVRP